MRGAPAILPAHGAFAHRVSVYRPHRVQHVHLLVANFIGIERDHRFHGHETEKLHQVILYHVAQGPRMVVIGATMPYAHLFSHGNGHVIHVTPVPDRLEERIGEAECQNVLHGLFAQVMVDAKNLRFVKTVPERAIHLPR